MPITIVNHPLVQHKLGLLREADISTYKFRTLTHELARLLAYEATRDFELEPVTIDGWCGDIHVQRIKGKKVTVVPILRAGLGMLDGVLDLVPSAKVADSLDERIALTIDPMLATGGSMIATIDLLKRKGCQSIKAIVMVAAPEGVKAVSEAHPDVEIVTAALDSHLNEHGYIIPGLGDAGDKIFGTKHA